MEVLRTPDSCFDGLPGYDYPPSYLTITDRDTGQPLRQHYLDLGPGDAPPLLLLHGEPSWSYLYRRMIPGLLAAGRRVVAPDLIGFGRSDKPAAVADYSYQRHVDWLGSFIEALDLRQITLFCQDWGGLLGLRLVAEHGQRFAAVLAANTFLPTGDSRMPDAFLRWREYALTTPELPVGQIVARGCVSQLDPAEVAAYDAPFPEERYKAGARAFPQLVPARPDDPASEANRQAWQALMAWQKPFLTVFSDQDPITRGAEAVLRRLIPGTRGQPHRILTGGGHFLQEDVAEALVESLLDLAASVEQGSD